MAQRTELFPRGGHRLRAANPPIGEAWIAYGGSQIQSGPFAGSTLDELVEKEVELLRRTTRRSVELQADLEEGLPPVLGEPGMLGSALINLCVNAMDAMEAVLRNCRRVCLQLQLMAGSYCCAA